MSYFQPIVDKFKSKLPTWKDSTLSNGGKFSGSHHDPPNTMLMSKSASARFTDVVIKRYRSDREL